MTSSKTDPKLTAEQLVQQKNLQMNERYEDGLTELTEQKKLGLIAQDEFDRLHQDLVKKVYGN